MTHEICRAEMVEWMESDGSAHITERPKYHWRRLNTIVADQGDLSIAVELNDFHVFELCLSGRLTGFVKGELEGRDSQFCTLAPNALQFTQSGSTVEFEVEDLYTVQQIYIDDAVFKDVAESVAPGDPDKLKLFGFHGIFDPHLKLLANQILDEARQGAPGGELYADLLAQQIALTLLRRNLGDAEKKPTVRSLSDAELSTVIDFMEANLEEVGGMDTLAALIGMDVYAFTRGFKAKTGEAPHQFLLGRRLARVKDMLAHSRTPLAEIAYATGFCSQPHMTAAFTKTFGMPPGAYRKTLRL